MSCNVLLHGGYSLVAGCGVIIAVVVEPLTAASAPADGAVAGGPGGNDLSIISGAGGICCASPAGIGISGGNGSVTGGVGFEGSGIGLGLAGSSVSPGIVCDPSGGVGAAWAQIAGSVIINPTATAPKSKMLRMIFFHFLCGKIMRRTRDSSSNSTNAACGSPHRSLTVHA